MTVLWLTLPGAYHVWLCNMLLIDVQRILNHPNMFGSFFILRWREKDFWHLTICETSTGQPQYTCRLGDGGWAWHCYRLPQDTWHDRAGTARAGFFYPGKFPDVSCSVGHLQTVITDRFDRADRRCQTDCHTLSDVVIAPDRPGFGLGINIRILACKALRIIYGMEVAPFHTDVVRRITNTAWRYFGSAE